MPRHRLRDARGGAEGPARAPHGHEDAPKLPVRVQTGGKQAPGTSERASERTEQDIVLGGRKGS